MMILPTYSPCILEDDVLWVDRKFHIGVCLYAEQLSTKIIVIAPALDDRNKMMDLVEIPVKTLPYLVETVRCDGSYRLEAGESERIRKLVERSTLVYGMGLETHVYAKYFGIPYVPIVECNLPTQIELARLPVAGALRRAVRAGKAVLDFVGEIRDLRAAHSVHCNGYPIYNQTRRLRDDCLLYLDSRMADNMIIDATRLESRLGEFATGRRARLLYSGRYEALKGAIDVVEVGLELKKRKVDFELDLFGKGIQVEEMRRRVDALGAGDSIRVNDAIPYPQLVERSHSSDLFVCCHVQDDPSCTYLEASGSGLPIAGYGNRMWKPFALAAGNGVVTKIGRPRELAEEIERLLSDRPKLFDLSRKSREFALKHTFEKEFEKRMEAVQKILQERDK